MSENTELEPDDPVIARSEELIHSAEQAVQKLDAQAPAIQRAYEFMRTRRLQNNINLELQLSFVRRGH
jgi:hypothetical protein